MMTKQKKIAAAASAAFILLVGGGWQFAKHQATNIAQDNIDGFIIRHDLRGKIAYDDLSASPFGSVTLSGVKLKLSPTNSVSIAALDISNVEMKYDQLRSVTLAARGTEIPLLAIAREQRGVDAGLRTMIGMGYTTLKGDLGLSVRYEDMKGILSVETSGNFTDFGAWAAKISLGGIDPNSVSTLYNMANVPAETNPFAILAAAGQGLQGLASVSLAQAEVSIDSSGFYKRDSEVIGYDLPPEGAAAQGPESIVDEMELVKAGMAPSEASTTRAAVDSWVRKGGSLKIKTNLAQPLALFRNANFLMPAFSSPAGYLAATKSSISN